jgi:hypothetical protein
MFLIYSGVNGRGSFFQQSGPFEGELAISTASGPSGRVGSSGVLVRSSQHGGA